MTAFRIDCFAFSFFHHFLGVIPCIKKVTTLERLIQTIFTVNKSIDPNAWFQWREPIKSPETTRGGSRATATMTPTRACDMPLVNERDPAIPDANARMMYIKFTFVLDRISVEFGLIVKMIPKIIPIVSAIRYPARLVVIAC